MKSDNMFEEFMNALLRVRRAMNMASVESAEAEITIGFHKESDMYHFQSELVRNCDPMSCIPMTRDWGNLGRLVGFDLKLEVRKPTTATVKMPDGSVRHLRPGESLTIETKAK